MQAFSQENKYLIEWQTIQLDEAGKARFSFKDATYPSEFNGLPAFSIMVQGQKKAVLGDPKYVIRCRCSPTGDECLVSPFRSRRDASREAKFDPPLVNGTI